MRGTRQSPLQDSRTDTVHPRVCGEHNAVTICSSRSSGSSPRVRGTRSAVASEAGLPRFIPACAGNTPYSYSRRSSSPVHPRVCGEHGAVGAARRGGHGSSPRVRGTRSWPFPEITRGSVHPRVCGEHIPAKGLSPSSNGSSPRVRGTPALVLPSALSEPVHPRVCGEHRVNLTNFSSNVGSSPRVRGTRPVPRCVVRRARFIPACAGNTLIEREPRRTAPVHPRVCGEHRRRRKQRKTRTGSSPRVRGTLQNRVEPDRPGRFIPACAGNTRLATASTSCRSVHPRVCGEHDRGRRVLRAGCRFIPACAGNTV